MAISNEETLRKFLSTPKSDEDLYKNHPGLIIDKCTYKGYKMQNNDLKKEMRRMAIFNMIITIFNMIITFLGLGGFISLLLYFVYKVLTYFGLWG